MTRRVLFVVSGSVESASARYRCGHLAMALAMGAGTETSVVSADAARGVRIRSGDVVVLHRVGFAGIGERLLRAAKRAGAVAVWSTDDLIFTPDFAHQIGLHFPDDPVRYAQHRGAGEDFARMLRCCDAVIVSTDYLGAQVRRVLAVDIDSSAAASEVPVFTLRNFLVPEQMTQAAHARRAAATVPSPSGADVPVHLAYLSGSSTHDLDLALIAAPLAAILTRFPQVRLLLVGPVSPPPLLRPFAETGQVFRHPFVPWRDLPELLTHGRIDINLAPLDLARPFGHAKSEVKFLEAAAVGIPTIASHAAGFAEGTRPGHDCLLAANSADWEQLLSDLIQQPEMRRRVGESAQTSLRERGTAAANCAAVHSVFEQLGAQVPEGSSGRVTDARAADQASEVWVRPTPRESFVRVGRNLERRCMRGWLRAARHLRLLADEVRGGG